MTPEILRIVLEAAMLAAGRALTLDDFLALFEGSKDAPDRAGLRQALGDLEASLEGRAVELVEVASGYRLQVREEYSPWLGGLFAERPPRYSRALLETLALIAYRQPITRGEIEDVRGVAVSSNIIKTLMEREWIRVLGHREVPGRPALFGTTREFLDHFGLKSLDGLPPLADIRDLEQLEPDLFAPMPREAGQVSGPDDEAPGQLEAGDEAGTDEGSGHEGDAGDDGGESGSEAAIPGAPASEEDWVDGRDEGQLAGDEGLPLSEEASRGGLPEASSPDPEPPAGAVDVAEVSDDDRQSEEESLELGGAEETEGIADAEGDPVIGDARREG